MIKCCYYNKGRLIEHDGLRIGGVIQLTKPSEDEIAEVAKFFFVPENHMRAFISGDFNKVQCNQILAARFISHSFSQNVMLLRNFHGMIIYYDKADDLDEKNRESEELIDSLWGTSAIPQYINIDIPDLTSIFRDMDKVYFSSFRNLDDINYAKIKTALPELLSAIDKSKKALVNVRCPCDARLNLIEEILIKIKSELSIYETIALSVGFDDGLKEAFCTTIISPSLEI